MAGRHLHWLTGLAAAVWTTAVVVNAAQAPAGTSQSAPRPHVAAASLFQPSDACLACHNSLVTDQGEDISIGAAWRASMMANAVRDPYWQAAVRREIMDHPEAQAEIEDECSICHMPMATFPARASGGKGRLFAFLPVTTAAAPEAALAVDGVSCAVCHQLAADRLGDPSTFTGGYLIDTTQAAGRRPAFGPFAVDAGRASVMRSSAGFVPTQGTHIQRSELCASCHTLFTHALAPGTPAGSRLPEQTPYLEWQQSDYRATASCQSCHMPVVAGETAIASVLGQPRPEVSRHSFRGGNFFMMRMLNRYRDELGVRATPGEMTAAIQRTVDHLQRDTARVSLANAARAGGRLVVDVDIENLAGHKFPTAYPSRRAWLQVSVTDAAGRTMFESGAFSPDGRIAGNDQDADPLTFEPHFTAIERADQVQIYESMMVDPKGAVTTGLLTGSRYVKDNRLLPRGFPKASAPPEVAVAGDAAQDADFAAGRDRVRYAIDPGGAAGPFTVVVRLWYQPIGYRWAENLRAYAAPEPQRFVRYYQSMAAASAIVIAETHGTIR